jgi:hypothetical protein
MNIPTNQCLEGHTQIHEKVTNKIISGRHLFKNSISQRSSFANFSKIECLLPGEEKGISLGKEANSEADQT